MVHLRVHDFLVEDPLVPLGCCLLFSWIVVSLSILFFLLTLLKTMNFLSVHQSAPIYRVLYIYIIRETEDDTITLMNTFAKGINSYLFIKLYLYLRGRIISFALISFISHLSFLFNYHFYRI